MVSAALMYFLAINIEECDSVTLSWTSCADAEKVMAVTIAMITALAACPGFEPFFHESLTGNLPKRRMQAITPIWSSVEIPNDEEGGMIARWVTQECLRGRA